MNSPWLTAAGPFLLAGIVCMAVVPLTVVLATMVGRGAVGWPTEARDIHSKPTPRLGGIAMFLGFGVALGVFGSPAAYRWQVIAVTGAIAIAMAVDDILRLPWWTKLALEVGAGIAVAMFGIAITFFAVPGPHGAILVNLAWLAIPVTVAWIVGMQISINFIDGCDGVAAGVTAIVAGVMLLASINRLGGPNTGIQEDVIVMSAALMGCCLGFLVFNWSPARVFMGDSGSHFLGVALGAVTILGVAKIAVALALFVPLLALGLPIGDTAFAIVRRRRNGTSFAAPDAGHIHHRLLDRGLSQRETAITFYLSTGILGCVGLAIFGHKRVLDIAAGLLVVALVVVLWRSRHRRPWARGGEDDTIHVVGRPATPRHVRHSGELD